MKIKIQKLDKSTINIEEEIKRLENNKEFSLILIV